MATGSVTITKTSDGVVEYFLTDPEVGSVWAITRPIDLNDPKAKKHIRRLLHQITGADQTTQLSVEFFTTNQIELEPESQGSKLVSEGNPLKKRVPSARYLIIKVIDTKVNFNWELFGFELWGTKTSRRF